jgi:hypothetical protein
VFAGEVDSSSELNRGESAELGLTVSTMCN